MKQIELTHIGSFTDEAEAALARDVAAFLAWGDFAHLNNPREIVLDAIARAA